MCIPYILFDYFLIVMSFLLSPPPYVGKPYVTEEGILPATHCPPPGYHSVEGKVGKELNYEEVVVYQARQAIPSYLIVYSF